MKSFIFPIKTVFDECLFKLSLSLFLPLFLFLFHTHTHSYTHLYINYFLFGNKTIANFKTQIIFYEHLWSKSVVNICSFDLSGWHVVDQKHPDIHFNDNVSSCVYVPKDLITNLKCQKMSSLLAKFFLFIYFLLLMKV